MIKSKSFGVIGGDMRQLYMSESIANDGNYVKTFGINVDEPKYKDILDNELKRVIDESEYIILPIPATTDGKTLNAPLWASSISLNDKLANLFKNKKIFCGMAKSLKPLGEKWNTLKMWDYYSRDEFAILNALPTAEGAIQVAMGELNKTISSSKFLVTGFGRIGRVLARLLKNMGADVSVSARKAADLAWIQVMGYTPVNTSSLPQKLEYDIIFNTIPHLIFGHDNLLKCSYKSIIIDLSSKPGGVDFSLAEFLGIKAIHALALPGKFSPCTAGEIIKKTVYNIIEEERL